MTLYGKILVLTNFALSLMAMTFAMLFYFFHIDWTEGGTPPKEPGQLRPRKERVDSLWKGVAAADASWREVHAELLEQESYRAADRSWYAAELDLARTTATDMPPAARTVVYDKGLLVLAPVENQPKHLRPKMVDATDDIPRPDGLRKLASLAWYKKVENDKRTAVIQQSQELSKKAEQDKDLTNRLTPENGKGLRQRIEDEKVKVKLVDEELALTRPLRVNIEVENELIIRRAKELRTRIDELKAGLGVAEK